MTSVLLSCAARVVRGWTRIYTLGLPAAERAARRAEVESDLWEFEHDPEAQGRWAAAQVLARLLMGIADDVAWRIEIGASEDRAPVRALAAAGVMTGPRRVSAFGLAATIHVVAMSAGIWAVSRGPAPSTVSGATTIGRTGVVRRVAPDASRNPGVGRERHDAAAMRMAAQSVAAPATSRGFSVVSAVTHAVAGRLGLIARPPSSAQAASAADGPARSDNASVVKMPAQTIATRAFGTISAVVVAAAARVGLIPRSGHLAAQPLSSAPDRFVAKLLQNRYALSVRDGQLLGAGAEVVQSAMSQSQFVLLGEDHGVAQTADFGAAVCRAAAAGRFETMAIEEGAVAAAELERLARRRDGLAQLAALERTFPRSLGVYDSREDFEMLQRCASAGPGRFHVWGLNQEGLGAGGLILSRILDTRPGEHARAAMQQLVQKNDDAYRNAVRSGGFGDLFMLSADDRDLERGAALLQQEGSSEARSLFAELVESHEINRTSPMDYDNARRREHLMKTRFAAEYARALRTAATTPRILLRFGAYHIYRGLNPVRGSGIGNYVAEFAEAQGTQSLHIRLMPVKGSAPFRPRVGQPAQLRSFDYDEDPHSEYLQPLLTNRLPSDWTLFDLRPLRHDFNALVRAPNPELATLVFGIDLLVIVPEATPTTEIH